MYLCTKIVPKMDSQSRTYSFIVENSLESTNTYAKELLSAKDCVDRTVIVAESQTKGRGQHTNKWESQDGKNLTFSIVFFPEDLQAYHQFYLSRAIALGLTDYLSTHVNNVSIKWPNDIYVGNKKIAGILIENTVMGANIRYSICGIGININQEEFISDAPNPISLKQLTAKEYSLDDELVAIIESIEKRYSQLENYDLELLDMNYASVLYRKSGYHLFNEEGEVFRARIHSITDIGQMVLEKENGQQNTYNFKEVSYII